MRVAFYSRKFIDFFRVFVKQVFLILLMTLTACVRKSEKIDPQKGVLVKVANYTENLGVQLQTVRIKSLTDLSHLIGKNIRFEYLPRVNQRGEQAIFTGRSVVIQVMENQQNVFIAENEFSLGLLTAYWHLDQLIEQTKEFGFQDLLHLPFKVGVVHNNTEGVMNHNNASYLPDYDAILIQPYSLNAVPILMNSGIIAHEYFHMLFQKLIHAHLKSKITTITKIPDAQFLTISVSDSNMVYHAVLLRAIEEGLADFWGWAYSKDEDFVSRSIPNHTGQARRMSDEEISELKSKLELEFLVISYLSEKNEVDHNYLQSEVYRIGSRYSRQMKKLAQIHGTQATQLALLKALSQLQETYNLLKSDIKLEPDFIIYLTTKELENNKEKVKR